MRKKICTWIHPTVLFISLLLSSSIYAKVEEAIFAGGCFWALEADFDHLKGVLNTVVGYDGDTAKNPRFSDVISGKTHYIQAIRVVYNSSELSYKDLVDFFWHHIDPTDQEGQFCDKGSHFRAAIFYLNKQQHKIALASKKEIEGRFPVIYTQILPSKEFYAAEDEQQDYYEKNPIRYRFYRYRCGRENRIQKLWQQNDVRMPAIN